MKRDILKMLAILSLVFVMYLPSLSSEFIVDDHVMIKDNPAIRSASPLWLFGQTFLPPVQTALPPPYYRPISVLWLWLGFHIWGLDAFMFRLFNIFFYFAIIIAVFSLSRRFFTDKNIAFLATAVFALHPTHIESVAFICGITDLSAGLFFILAMLAFDSYKSFSRLVLAPIFFALALFSKETAAAGIFIFPLYLYLVKGENWKKSITKSLHLLIPFVLYFALRYWVLFTFGSYTPIWYDFFKHIAMLPYLFVRYVQNLIIPLSLSPYHGEMYSYHSLFWWLMWIIPMLAIIIPSILWIRSKKVWFAILWVIILLFPALGIMQHRGAIWAERFIFVPSFGMSIIFGYAYMELKEKIRLEKIRLIEILICSYITALFLIGITYSVYFRSDWLWFGRVIHDSPRSAMGYCGIAEQFKDINQLDSAYYYTRLALEQDSTSAWVFASASNIALRMGKYDDVLKYSKKLRETDPNFPTGYIAPAIVYFERGDTLLAIQYADSAANVGKFDPWICLKVGKIFIQLGDTAKALENFNRASQLLPDNEKIHTIIMQYLRK